MPVCAISKAGAIFRRTRCGRIGSNPHFPVYPRSEASSFIIIIIMGVSKPGRRLRVWVFPSR